MQSYNFQTHKLSMAHPDFLKLFYGFTYTKEETQRAHMKESCGLEYLFFIPMKTVQQRGIVTKSNNHIKYDVSSLPFKASTFSCFPFLYSFLRFLILKKGEKGVKGVVEVDRELRNQVFGVVREFQGLFPSRDPWWQELSSGDHGKLNEEQMLSKDPGKLGISSSLEIKKAALNKTHPYLKWKICMAWGS